MVAAAKKSKTRSKEETMGQRLARLRKERGLTQAELAELLQVDQPRVSMYERGELRFHGELIVELTKIFRVSADEILGLGAGKESKGAVSRRWHKRIQQIDALSRSDQRTLLRTIDGFLRGTETVSQ